MNTLNKFLLGASIVGSLYLAGCGDAPNIKQPTTSADGFANITRDSTQKILSVKTGEIQLDSNKVSWNNAKLISKDVGVVYEYSDGHDYLYSECLFRNPVGEEITLFGHEDVLFVGQNYDIQFYKLTPNQNITSSMVLAALEKKSRAFARYNDLIHGLEGLLNSYVRVTNEKITK